MFVPGPVDVAPEVLDAMAKPLIPHRSKEYEAIHRRASEKARQLFQTDSRVLIGTHTGSGMQECGVRNLANRDILVCVNGAFSQRWFDVAVTNGKHADRLDIEWGKAIPPDELKKVLKKKKYEAVSIVHNETSTGVMNPIEDLAKAVREVSPEMFIMVDAVSSLGGVKIEMDAWDIDFILTSSQKCLALPPGLSFMRLTSRWTEFSKKASRTGMPGMRRFQTAYMNGRQGTV
jgi:aspartate aminotransferase-like enzyme